MNKANNQTYQETEKKLQEGLFEDLEQGLEPTVQRLCEKAQINRSTFYRHYRDLPDLMEKTEQRIQQGLNEILMQKWEKNEDRLAEMVAYIGRYQSFYRIFLKNYPSRPFTGLGTLWETRLKPGFNKVGVYDEKTMLYYYQFVQAGCSQVLKYWIEQGCTESPEEISVIIRRMLVSSYIDRKL